jgi:hypothetical protein
MGLKSGSRSPGFNDDEEEEEQEDQTETPASEKDEFGTAREEQEAVITQPADGSEKLSTESQTESETADQRPSMDSIPYKLRRDKVNQGRQQVPFFLREKVIESEAGLKTALEEMLDESVYKSDYREAAMVVAQRNPELVAEVLREWGYDLE